MISLQKQMRILIHDYSGHPFQVQLTRELAQRGHEARHVFSAAFQTPKGNLVKHETDPKTFSVIPIILHEEFKKSSFIKRRSQEIEQGILVAREIEKFRPDIVISSNAPLDTQRKIWSKCIALDIPRIFWIQDIYSEAISRFLQAKSPILNATIGAYYRSLEARLLRASNGVIAISAGFLPRLEAMGVLKQDISVIENWAPLNELPLFDRENEWTNARLIEPDRPRILYSGTLGMKHNPDYLLSLAEHYPEAMVVICSEGPAVDSLKSNPRALNLQNIRFLPWVSFSELPMFLSGGDILVVLLEEDAGLFSVPSKILTYCAMGRSVLGAIPAGNLGAQIIDDNDIGLTSSPGDLNAFIKNAGTLINNPELRRHMGSNGRAYAERAFDIRTIGDHFELILSTSFSRHM